jgi:hypothetical protein
MKGNSAMALRVVALILIACLGGYVYTVNQEAKESTITEDGSEGPVGVLLNHDQEPKYEKKGVDAEGVKPDQDPAFDVSVELVMKGEQPNLYFTVTEQHGWYAGTVQIMFWRVIQGEDGNWTRDGQSIQHLCHNFLDFNATLVCKTVPLPHEFPEINEDWGTSENWNARVVSWGGLFRKK